MPRRSGHRSRPLGAWAVIAIGAVLLPGCAQERPTRTEAAMNAQHEAFVRQVIADRAELSRTFVNRWKRELDEQKASGKPAVFDVLILSGGGDFGAFGAGVLKGWATVDDPEMTRPEFDVVSGVSTGALIAPLAFAGTEEAYERAFQTYQNPKKDWFKERGLLTFLLQRTSYVDSSGLVRDIKAAIDDPIIAAIAERAAGDRALVIGTTNMDQGMLKMWELGPLAAKARSDSVAKNRLYDILVASAAIPGAFPPVEMDGDLYVDGGVTRNIAFLTDQDFEGSADSIWRREFPGQAQPRVRLWIIINNQLGTSARSMQPAWPGLLKRALEMAIRANTLATLKALQLAMSVMRARGTDVDFHFIAIPDQWRAPVEGTFVKETMQDLAQLGYKLGCDPASWSRNVPDAESPTSPPAAAAALNK